jgi:hypothetical protein
VTEGERIRPRGAETRLAIRRGSILTVLSLRRPSSTALTSAETTITLPTSTRESRSAAAIPGAPRRCSPGLDESCCHIDVEDVDGPQARPDESAPEPAPSSERRGAEAVSRQQSRAADDREIDNESADPGDLVPPADPADDLGGPQ